MCDAMDDPTSGGCFGAPAPKNAPRWLYLHGFGSSPESTKARAIAAHFAARGVAIERLDLRKPSFEQMRLSAMVAHVRERIGDDRDRAVVFGSSLGGLTAARAAEEDARIGALVLLAPAFRMAERWRARVGEDAWRDYERSGWVEAQDYAEKRKRKVDFGFFEDVTRVDARSGGWPDVRVPTLIVHGVHDDVVGVDLSRTWARGKRHVRLVEVDDGHELALSIPRIVRECDDFIRNYLDR
jgi:pimeloyl-ACP methyl ester carboxylesterase